MENGWTCVQAESALYFMIYFSFYAAEDVESYNDLKQRALVKGDQLCIEQRTVGYPKC